MPIDPVARFIHAAVGVAVELTDNVQDLDDILRANKAPIAELHLLAPALWQDLSHRAPAHRATLRAAGHLTPASARPSTVPPPATAVAAPAAYPTGVHHGQGQGSLFR